MFADDTNISVTGTCFSDVQASVNSKLEIVKEWLTANKLSINVTKTEYILIASKHKITNLVNPLNIELGDQPIKRVTGSKYLGMYLDEDLFWNEHVDYIARKISSVHTKTGSPFCNTINTAHHLQVSILPHFDYKPVSQSCAVSLNYPQKNKQLETSNNFSANNVR